MEKKENKYTQYISAPSMGKPVRPYGCYLVGMGLPID